MYNERHKINLDGLHAVKINQIIYQSFKILPNKNENSKNVLSAVDEKCDF